MDERHWLFNGQIMLPALALLVGCGALYLICSLIEHLIDKSNQKDNIPKRVASISHDFFNVTKKIADIQSDLENRIKLINTLQQEVEAAESTISLTEEQVKAIRSVLNREIKHENKKNLWQGVIVNTVFFGLGVLCSLLIK